MNKLSKLQQIAVEHLEMNVSDVWRQFLQLIRSNEPISGTDIEHLGCNVERVKNRLEILRQELGCRWVLELQVVPDCEGNKIGHLCSRIFLLEKEDKLSRAMYKGYDVNFATDCGDLIKSLSDDICNAFKLIIPTLLNWKTNDTKTDQEDTFFYNAVIIDSINKFVANRFGEDESNVLVWLDPKGVVQYAVYQASLGKRVPLYL